MAEWRWHDGRSRSGPRPAWPGNAGESLALMASRFAEDSVVRRVSAEGALLLGGGRAL